MSRNSVYDRQYRTFSPNYISQDPYDSAKQYERHRDFIREKLSELPNSPRSKLKIEQTFDDLLDHIYYTRKPDIIPYPYYNYNPNYEQTLENYERKYQETLQLLEKEKNFRLILESENDSLKARMTYLIDLEKQFEDSRIRAARGSELQTEIDQLNTRINLLLNENEDLRRKMSYSREYSASNNNYQEEIDREVLKNQELLRKLKDFKCSYEELRRTYAHDINSQKEKFDSLYEEKMQVESWLRDLKDKYEGLLKECNNYKDSEQQYRSSQRNFKESERNYRDTNFKEDQQRQNKEPEKVLKASVSPEEKPRQIGFYERPLSDKVKLGSSQEKKDQENMVKTRENAFYDENEQNKHIQKADNKNPRSASDKPGPDNPAICEEIQENFRQKRNEYRDQLKKIPSDKPNGVSDARIKDIEDRLYSLQEKLAEQNAVNQKILNPKAGSKNSPIVLSQRTPKSKDSTPTHDKKSSPYAISNISAPQKTPNRRNSARKDKFEMITNNGKNMQTPNSKSKNFTSRDDFCSQDSRPLSQSRNYEKDLECKTCTRKHGQDWARSSSKQY